MIDSQYNLAGLRTALWYYEYYTGKQRWVAYDYDSAGRVKKVYETTGAQKIYADNILYHAHGAVSSLTLSNGAMQQSAQYSSRLQPTTLTVTKVSPASTVMNFTYTFTNASGQNNGNVVAMSDMVQNLAYGFQYDELNRLARAETTNSNLWGNTYSYDIWGNLHAKNQIAGTQQGEYFQQTMTAQNQFAGWSYDAAGNLLNDGAHNYQFDPEGRIKCLDAGANCASPAASYVYSVEGRRVKRTASGTTTWYAHDGGSALSEFSNPAQGSGTWRKDYIYLNGQLLATESPTDGTRYHFSDHLGTPRVITDAAGTVLSRHDYYPYGMELTPWTDGESHKFTGNERDTESGLDNFGARYNSSGLGRFMSADPLKIGGDVVDLSNPQAWNAYTYVINNPLNVVDPDGLDYNLIGGDRCGKDIQCDKEGFVTDDKGNRVIITDEQIADSNGLARIDDNGNLIIKTPQGEFQGAFFDPNPLTIKVSPSMSELNFMALEDAGAMAQTGVTAGAVVIGIPNALALGGAVAATAGPGATLTLGSRVVTPTPGQLASISRAFAQGGRRAVEKALRSYERRLAEHEAKLAQYRASGGHTSYVEGEIRNLRGLIQAARDLLARNP